MLTESSRLPALVTVICVMYINNNYVVYFDQSLGAAHSKRWLKSTFSMVFCAKSQILASVWSAQHLNTGQIIQQMFMMVLIMQTTVLIL